MLPSENEEIKTVGNRCRFCGYEPAAHHRLLISEFEKVAHGETARLAIFMPPTQFKRHCIRHQAISLRNRLTAARSLRSVEAASA